MKTYIAHYTPLADRKKNMEQQLEFYNIDDYVFIEDEPNEAFLNRYAKDPDSWQFKTVGLGYNPPFREMSCSEISLFYKHTLIYRQIQNGEDDWALVLEDDAEIISPDFKKVVNTNIENTPDDWDMIFIGDGCGLHIPKQYQSKGQVAYLKEHPATKCTDSYLITKEAAKILYNSLLYYVLPIDFELNFFLKELNFKVYWWEPNLVTQGSQSGTYQSEILKG